MKREPALKLIIAWKVGRAVLSLLAGIAIVVLLAAGLDGPLRELVGRVHEHVVSQLALWVVKLVMSAIEPGHIVVVAAGLILDAGVVFVEGWALWKGYRWGAWLVVVATAVLVPFEVVAIIDHVSVVRLVVLALNLAIVAWLISRRLRKPA